MKSGQSKDQRIAEYLGKLNKEELIAYWSISRRK